MSEDVACGGGKPAILVLGRLESIGETLTLSCGHAKSGTYFCICIDVDYLCRHVVIETYLCRHVEGTGLYGLEEVCFEVEWILEICKMLCRFLKTLGEIQTDGFDLDRSLLMILTLHPQAVKKS